MVCEKIKTAINIALSGNNTITEISEYWSEANKVYYFKNALSSEEKGLISQIDNLRYWRFKGSPHYKVEEGCCCDTCKIHIVFPVKYVRRRFFVHKKSFNCASV